MIDCNDCIHLNITEEQQYDSRKDHICLKYNKRVIHNSYNHKSKTHNKKLHPCRECCENNYENYKNIIELIENMYDFKLHEYQKELIKKRYGKFEIEPSLIMPRRK